MKRVEHRNDGSERYSLDVHGEGRLAWLRKRIAYLSTLYEINRTMTDHEINDTMRACKAELLCLSRELDEEPLMLAWLSSLR